MAQLQGKKDITVEDLEESLGAKKLPAFIKTCEKEFIDQIDHIVDIVINDPQKKAVFVSGPTSSGKTTFTMRLSAGLTANGRQAAFLSLDDYYAMKELQFDRDGRPDFETIDSLDVERAASDVKRIIAGERIVPPFFNFMTRRSEERSDDEAIELPENGVLVVEGLHGLNKRISGDISDKECLKIFIMPYGNVFCDTKLMDMTEIRLLRRIVRDQRHRAAHALATVDYWPMIERSEEKIFDDYLESADIHVNSFLGYESLILAPMALADIRAAFKMVEDGTLTPNVFMERSNKDKAFADLSTALDRCARLEKHLCKIPEIDPEWTPEESILNEFIS
ncbi:MAG TPA: hypothetical protein DCW41_00865 [Clostridiales bacterium]|nr:hypothetical protein [Clostridiales bacterium]